MEILQRNFDQPAYATATVAPAAANTTEVTITLRNVNGKPVGPTIFPLYLSSAAAPIEGLPGSTPSAMACKTPGVLGTDFGTLVTRKSLLVQTMPNGVYVLSLTDAGKVAYRVCAQIGEAGLLLATLSAASYG